MLSARGTGKRSHLQRIGTLSCTPGPEHRGSLPWERYRPGSRAGWNGAAVVKRLRLAPGWNKPGLVPSPGDRKITLWAKKRYVYRGPGENAKMCLTPFWRKRFRRSCQILGGSGQILAGSGQIRAGSGRIRFGSDRTAGTFFSKRALSTF